MRPMNPRTKGTMMRQEDHGALVPASVRAMRIETSEGVRTRFPIQSIRFSLLIRDDSFVKLTWRNGTRSAKARPPMGKFSQNTH